MATRNRMVLSGTIAGGIETFSCSFDFFTDGGGALTAPSDVQAWAVAAAAALDSGETAYPEITAIMGANVNVTHVATYGYPATGPASATGSADCSWLGSGSIRVPFSTAVCVTKRTLLAGRSHRGRFYWPALAIVIDSDGHFTPDLGLAPAFASLYADLGSFSPTEVLIPAVYSATLDSMTQVTHVAVGDVPDSQRGRRGSLVEAYDVAAVA